MLFSFAETVRKTSLPFIAKEVKMSHMPTPQKSSLTGEKMTANDHSRTCLAHFVFFMRGTKNFS
jgi:hypothetical protein